MDYTWNSKKLKEMQDKLVELSSKGNEDTINDSITLKLMQNKMDLLSDAELELMEKNNDSAKKIANDTQNVYMIKKYAKDFLGKSLAVDCFISSFDLSTDDYLVLVHDFYKTHSPRIYELFLQEYNRRFSNLKINYDFKSSGITYHFLVEKENYLEIFLNNTYLDLTNIPHEYGHAITFLMNDNFVKNLNFCFARELDGYYFQTSFLDYLIENNILVEEAVLAKASIDYMMCINVRFLLNEANNVDSITRFYSYLASIELLMQDKKTADEILESIIKQNPKSPKEAIKIINSNITLGNSVSEFQKTLKNQLNKYLSCQR